MSTEGCGRIKLPAKCSIRSTRRAGPSGAVQPGCLPGVDVHEGDRAHSAQTLRSPSRIDAWRDDCAVRRRSAAGYAVTADSAGDDTTGRAPTTALRPRHRLAAGRSDRFVRADAVAERARRAARVIRKRVWPESVPSTPARPVAGTGSLAATPDRATGSVRVGPATEYQHIFKNHTFEGRRWPARICVEKGRRYTTPKRAARRLDESHDGGRHVHDRPSAFRRLGETASATARIFPGGSVRSPSITTQREEAQQDLFPVLEYGTVQVEVGGGTNRCSPRTAAARVARSRFSRTELQWSRGRRACA